jgi:hypothetical protein
MKMNTSLKNIYNLITISQYVTIIELSGLGFRAQEEKSFRTKIILNTEMHHILIWSKINQRAA